MKWLALVFAVVLAGCTASGVKVTEEQAQQFEKGKSTYAEVIAKLGEPTSSTLMSNGMRMASYHYFEAAARPETFIPIVGPLVGGADARSNMVMFTFDRNGVLQSYSATNSRHGRGMNAASGASSEREAQPRQTP